MNNLFITIRFLDVIDILLVTILMYKFYSLIRGTIAINIFIAVFTIYLVWLISRALNMELLASILGQIMGVGIISLVIVFQPEIRRFLMLLGTRYMSKPFALQNLFLSKDIKPTVRIKEIVRTCINLSKSKTGALIVIQRNSELYVYSETGVILNAETNSALLESIFFKNNPLHDGAVIIIDDRIFAARCMLPMSETYKLPAALGMRHRAAVGISELTDCFVIIISEETGKVSIADHGQLYLDINTRNLLKRLEENFGNISYTSSNAKANA